MSHELHTPLNAIIGFSELIAQETLGPISQQKYIEFARNIRTAGQRALGMFLDVQTMAELEAERFQLKPETIDLCEMARTTVAEFRQTDSGADREVHLETNAGGSVIHADPRAVKQMVLKLLYNAAKFSAAGTAIRVTVAGPDDGSPRVSVADTGIGMTTEEAELAVRPFRQIDGGLARHYEGLGLGLSIVRKLIERHGGHLTIASAPQKGTLISLDFPAPALRHQRSLPQYELSDIAAEDRTAPSDADLRNGSRRITTR